MYNIKINKVIKDKKILLWLELVLKKIMIGVVNIVIKKRLYECNPIIFIICKISLAQDVLYAHKFHGKPVNSFDLK
tara:strand:- start:248 stop:475 length:228 start_codon:yes stop_codon:yes gene_type:complete